MFKKIFNRFIYLIWLLGLIIPGLYLLFITEIKSVIQVAIHNKWLKYLSIFIGIQLFCLLLSYRFDFFTFGRAAAALHNVVALSMIFLGFALVSQAKFREYLNQYIFELFLVLSFIIIATFTYSLIYNQDLFYNGLLGVFGENKFSVVRFNRLENTLINNFPRSSVLSIFPNATAVLMFLIHTLVIAFREKELSLFQRVFSYGLLIVVLFITGSRLFLVFGLIAFALSFIKRKKELSFLIFISPILLFITYEFLSFLMELRPGSNVTRGIILKNSFEYYWSMGPVFGLGIKPLDTNVLEGLTYPIGSHSTYLGYYVKSGLIGGLFFTGMILVLLFKILKKIFRWILTSLEFKSKDFYLLCIFIMLLFGFIFEDLDAYDLIPFYCGMLLFRIQQIIEPNVQ